MQIQGQLFVMAIRTSSMLGLCWQEVKKGQLLATHLCTQTYAVANSQNVIQQLRRIHRASIIIKLVRNKMQTLEAYWKKQIK